MDEFASSTRYLACGESGLRDLNEGDSAGDGPFRESEGGNFGRKKIISSTSFRVAKTINAF